jgi:hypothetical protein
MSSYTHVTRTTAVAIALDVDQAYNDAISEGINELRNDALALCQYVGTAVLLLLLPVAVLVAIGRLMVQYAINQALLGYKGCAKRITINDCNVYNPPIRISYVDDTLDLPIETPVAVLHSTIDGYPVDPDQWPDCGLVAYPLSDWSKFDVATVAACDSLDAPTVDPIKPVKVATPIVDTPTNDLATDLDGCSDAGLLLACKVRGIRANKRWARKTMISKILAHDASAK